MFSKELVTLAGLALVVPQVWAGFSSSSNKNVAVYWGAYIYYRQGKTHATKQPLRPDWQTIVLIIPLAFLNVIVNPTTVNFANAGDNCTTFPNSNLLSCPQIEQDIKTCQSTYGKTILLSIGGATYTEGGFTSASQATTWADNIWAMFGPVQSGSSLHRPFGSAVVDGFDFDFETTTSNMAPFAERLRSNMDAATAAGAKKFYLSAAPQCVFPDAADHEMLDSSARFDFVMIQFYNNWCGASNFVQGSSTQNAFNFDVWDNWAKTTSANPNVRLLLGLPANSGAGGGYVSGSQLDAVIAYSKQYSSFGGVMLWDMSQLYANPGFLDSVVSALGNSGGGSNPPSPPKTTLTTVTRTTTTKSGTSPTGSLVPQWGQCGGQGYTGSTQCQPPYKCVSQSVWWAQCQ